MYIYFIKQRLSVFYGFMLVMGVILVCLLFIGTIALDQLIFQVFVVKYHLDYMAFREWTYVLYGILDVMIFIVFIAWVRMVRKRFVRAWGAMSDEDRRLLPKVYQRAVDEYRRNTQRPVKSRLSHTVSSNMSYFMAGNTVFYQKFGIIPIIFDIRDVVWAYGTRTPLEMPVTFAKEADISMHVNDLYGVTMVTKSGVHHHVTILKQSIIF